ncbi:MAG: FAD-dependent oxidoreductase [Treponema sp.]|jgi:dihydrolipoamide dehydrogenase|nr:FAD-dependent oxidoreductase [Treponema sp.]
MYDLAIIGAGPAGYLAAERLGHEKKKILLVEEKYLGGTCLNEGCIPTKTLVNSAKLYVHAKEGGKFGVHAEGVSFDWGAVQKWKNEVTGKLRDGIAAMMKMYGVDVAPGRGEIVAAPSGSGSGRIRVSRPGGGAGPLEYEARAILVSPGSVPALPPIPGSRNNPLVLDSTALLQTTAVPEKLTVIGGGVIGVEFAGLFSALGAKVTVIEMMDEIVPFMDREHSPLLRRAMKPVEFRLGCRVEKIEGAAVHYTTKDGKKEEARADLVLMAAGRRPVLEGWGAENSGIDSGAKGAVVDDRMRTSVPGIWAAGDVTGRSLLAHSAYRMAEVAAADISAYLDRTDGGAAGGKAAAQAVPNRMRYNAIPWAVYGVTEAAGVGITSQEAAARGTAVLESSLPMRISGRFAAENTFAGQGAVKVIASAESRKILGVHAVGAYASEFIWGGAALIEQEFRIEDVKQMIFPHPTVCELIRDAVWGL